MELELEIRIGMQSFYMDEERFYCVSNGKTKGCMLYSKKTWISLETGIRSLPGRVLSLTAGAEAFLLRLFRVVLKKYSNWGVLIAMFCYFQYIICNIQMRICNLRSMKLQLISLQSYCNTIYSISL
jgi:hypothetical protein